MFCFLAHGRISACKNVRFFYFSFLAPTIPARRCSTWYFLFLLFCGRVHVYIFGSFWQVNMNMTAGAKKKNVMSINASVFPTYLTGFAVEDMDTVPWEGPHSLHGRGAVYYPICALAFTRLCFVFASGRGTPPAKGAGGYDREPRVVWRNPPRPLRGAHACSFLCWKNCVAFFFFAVRAASLFLWLAFDEDHLRFLFFRLCSLTFSPHLCVGFLFLVVDFRPLPPPPAVLPPTTYPTHNSPTQHLLTHTTYPHTHIQLNLPTHPLPTHTTHPHTTWWHRPPLRVPGVALGDVDRQFAWQAWHLWHWARWTPWSPQHFAWQAWHLWHWAGCGDALGSRWTP